MMPTAKIFTPMQIMLLKEAVSASPGKRVEQIDGVTKLLKKQNPEKFFHDKDGKPDRAMQDRIFYDEPRNLELFQYGGYVLAYAGIKQSEIYKERNKRLLTHPNPKRKED